MSFKKMRERAKLTQVELAELLGVTQSAVSNWEAGLNMPTVANLSAMASICKCTVDDLLQKDRGEIA